VGVPAVIVVPSVSTTRNMNGNWNMLEYVQHTFDGARAHGIRLMIHNSATEASRTNTEASNKEIPHCELTHARLPDCCPIMEIHQWLHRERTRKRAIFAKSGLRCYKYSKSTPFILFLPGKATCTLKRGVSCVGFILFCFRLRW